MCNPEGDEKYEKKTLVGEAEGKRTLAQMEVRIKLHLT
jgi:hypothetical protein